MKVSINTVLYVSSSDLCERKRNDLVSYRVGGNTIHESKLSSCQPSSASGLLLVGVVSNE